MTGEDNEPDPPYRVYRAGEPDSEPPPRPAPAPGKRADPPASGPGYHVYRSRKGSLSRLRPSGLFRRRDRERDPDPEPRAPSERRRIGVRRLPKWIAFAVFGWVALSVIVFFVSAQFSPHVSDEAEAALSSGSSLATGSTVLILGSDARPEGTKEPGADPGGPSRSDSILLVRASVGKVQRLSILRDTFAEIPGAEAQKINAAYAIGGAALAIETVEKFLGNGLEINHVVEVSLENFPNLIDALGGIDVTTKTCIRSEPFGGYRVKLKKGTHHLNGDQALRFARVRKNLCAPNEDDQARAARQQELLRGIRNQLLSPGTFVRLPLVSWQAPRTIRSDMVGPGLFALFSDLVTGGSGKTRILMPSAPGPGGSLLVSDEEKRTAVKRLLGD